ncbi:MAG: RES family NAD+ phosphorylase [Candidatus Velthaea sp.]
MITAHIHWAPSYRLIAARLPRLDIFETVTSAADLPSVLELEALTNPRIRPALGPIQAIPDPDRVVGPGASFVMAAFAYPRAARFSDDEHGAYYAAADLETAVAEVSFHRARFAATTSTPPMDFDERIIEATIDAELADLRRLPEDSPIYDADPEHYASAQVEATRLRKAGAHGVVYRSVRRAGGECAAVFKPRLVHDAHTTGYVGLRWDGHAIIDAYRKDSLREAYPAGFDDSPYRLE